MNNSKDSRISKKGAAGASEAAVLEAAWDTSAQSIEGAMHAILHGVRDPELFDAEGKSQAAAIQEYIHPEDTVLELGCGIGRIVKHLAPLCKKIYGVDISKEMLAHAARWLEGQDNVALVHCNGKDLSALEDDLIDFVYSLLVLQHMDKNDAFVYLKEIFRILKDGGRALLNFPNILSEDFFRDFTYVSLLPQAERDPAKVRSYVKEEVVKIVESAGFTVLEVWENNYIYVHLEKKPASFPDRLILGENEAAVQGISGWYWLEEKEDFRFRWTRKNAPFHLKVDPSKKALKVIFACMHPQVNEKGLDVTLYQDGKRVSTERVREEGLQGLLFSIEPPSREEIRHFSLEVDRTFTPFRDLGKGDLRELGLALQSIELV
ncbi:MAG: class I SAM-dependent methyltransferase [Planctomycetota bacterium]|jgi:ubiquinone/menaquinone biosynthesis C-methylase UbiE